MPCGPGYASPLDALKNGPQEELIYVVCVQPDLKSGKSDFLATVDVNPNSKTYCQIIHRLYTNNPEDELHHSGWNVCSSCYKLDKGCKNVPKRDKLILPALGSGNIYVVDTSKPREPSIHKVISGNEMKKFNCTTPHTTHCLPTGEIMISVMGDNEYHGKGEFILVDSKTYEVKGTWTKGDKFAKFGYDFWYQPACDTMVSSEWGSPKIFKRGFQPSDASDVENYGRSLNIFSWKNKTLKQVINLGDAGIAPLEVRYLHNPDERQGFVGCALNANVFRFFEKPDGSWDTELVIDIPPKEVEGWAMPKIQGLISDIIISLDDKYLYLSCWLHGDVRQYDITNPSKPKLTGQVYLGGSLTKDSKIKVLNDPEGKTPNEPVVIKGKRLYGSPQMLQLSLDGKRLYISSSLFSPWDKQFYPDMVTHGSWMVKLDVDTENGGMKLDENFLIDFAQGPDGPCLAHEMRYPGGDCTSDIWLSDKQCESC